MRSMFLSVLLVLVVGTTVVAARPAYANGQPDSVTSGVHVGPAATAVDDHSESRVGVQLVVAGAAAAFVVGVGTAAYFLRRKLGLTAYSPDRSGDAGHH